MKLSCRAIICVVLGCLLCACDSGKKHSIDAKNLPAFVTQKGGKYIIKQGHTQLEILANVAGRIGSLKVDGQELLLTSAQSDNFVWGNGFWSSPQSEWSWPPLETLDSAPYDVSVVDNRIVFSSKTEKTTGYQFVKSYGLNPDKKCLSIIYSIYNHSDDEKNVAGWEVTRLPTSGMAFFPHGNTEISSGIFYPLPVDNIGDITWATYDGSKIRDNHHKLMTDGKEGWLAYVNKGKLLLKEFADVPVELIVSGEGEIELFANTEQTYWEIAQQGVMTKLAPGEHLEWEVLWHTRSLPADIQPTSGNPALADYVHGVLSGQN